MIHTIECVRLQLLMLCSSSFLVSAIVDGFLENLAKLSLRGCGLFFPLRGWLKSRRRPRASLAPSGKHAMVKESGIGTAAVITSVELDAMKKEAGETEFVAQRNGAAAEASGTTLAVSISGDAKAKTEKESAKKIQRPGELAKDAQPMVTDAGAIPAGGGEDFS